MRYYDFIKLCFEKIELTVKYNHAGELIPVCNMQCSLCKVHAECKEQQLKHNTEETYRDIRLFFKDHPEYLI